MSKTQFQFDRPEHGWMVVRVNDDRGRAELHVSDVPLDSLRMLVAALVELLAGSDGQEVQWSLEPEYALWHFERTECGVRLLVYPDGGRTGPRVFEDPGARMIHAVYKALRDLESEAAWPADGPACKAWSWPFPRDGLLRLGDMLKRAANKGPEPLTVEYLPDADVDETLDRQLRALLSTCFTKAGDEVFAAHRYYRQMPQHRWLVRGPDGAPIAHVAVHDKTISTAGGELAIAGVAEVCVHPDYRGRGLVRRMLAAVHEWLAGRDYAFAMLFGNPAVYSSSGYRPIANDLRMTDPASGEVTVGPRDGAMIRPVHRSDWPAGEIDLHGPTF